MIKRLKDEGKITGKIYDKMYLRDSRPGILYGLPKVHKPVIDNSPKFRSLLSAIGTPTFKLAKFLVPILSPFTVNEFSVHDSFSFANEVSSFCSDHFMASLDLESLFTNILLDEVIDICVNGLFSDTDTIHDLDKNDLRELLTLASFESFFIFDEILCRQIDYVAMSSPIGSYTYQCILMPF